MKTFWLIYQLCFFNVFQNAIKYNRHKGLIEIELFLNKTNRIINKNKTKFELITLVTDQGKGISEERQELMFVQFGELIKKQSQELVEDYGIGIGLSNSRELARSIGGNVKILKSVPGKT